ncbi:RagB/SusD family nutrient uptake outer membrane protein [Emticicia sp. CRIBPO]|uniref:RagB/SusD family nutrient uptake outer membrane protein n=1 Tax=Emticicia sp. CRIBPO TaxID=2683258 RepID=UPI0014137202|nr:RagB/SusD family nutrient uptake outer membrane protein [Emticicia sp. CRIBPO]NBA85259.1 RagB/SusD family nutrient uptake outer membrane protein [Emticicia sp. CRIBPO]
MEFNQSLYKKLAVKAGILVAVVLCNPACKQDLLDTAPYGSISSANMWNTDNLTDLGVAGVYNAMRLGIQNGGASDRELYQMDGLGFTSLARGGNDMTNGTSTTSSGRFSNTWKELYEGIHRANDAIANITTKSPSAPEKKARLIAECKFLRAYFYLRLNQLYKGVPVYLEPLQVTEMNRARETEAKVWEVIVKDLTDAISEPNLPAKYAAKTANYGRVTQGAAYALRGKAYLYMKKYAEAAADFAKVKDAGYKLFPNYKTLFKEANEQSDEMIFSLQHTGVDTYGSTTQWYCGTRSSFGSCWNNYYVSPGVVDLFENADGSPFNWDDVIPGYNSMPVNKREVYFFRNGLTAAEISTGTSKGLDMSQYLPNGNEERIAKAFANRDPRLGASVIAPYATYLGRPQNGADQVYVNRWPSRNEAPPVLDLFTDSRNQLFYLHRKFVYEGSAELLNRQFGPIDFPLIRYADVLLMWAEALNEQNKTQEAVALVNEVRGRAGIGLLNTSASTMVKDQADLRTRIRNERRVEFINEGINYFDELRWGTLKEKVFATGNGVNQIWGGVTVPYTWKDNITTWPIPQVEIEMNPKLTQNPGW